MKKGFTLVEIMIVVAIVALLAAIAIPNLLRMRINANESNAQATLKTIATAAEAFAAAQNGRYPVGYGQLQVPPGGGPAYITDDFTANLPRQGYNFACAMVVGSYNCAATPDNLGTSGTRSFRICTGGVLLEAAGAAAPACP